MLLTIKKLESVKPTQKSQKLSDGNGLYLFIPAVKVESTGNTTKSNRAITRSWRFDFRFARKRFTLAFGLYPVIGLADARELLHQAKKQLAAGINPALEKQAKKATQRVEIADTFSAISEHWYEAKQTDRSKPWRDANSLYLRRDLNPMIGNMPIKTIDRRLLLAVLDNTKRDRGVRTAERVRLTAIQVFDHAILKMKAELNPARMLRGWDEIPAANNHQPLHEGEIHAFLDRVDAYPGFLSTKLCIKLLLLTFVRKNELSQSRWSEFDLDSAQWIIPAERMKMKDPHIVPLSIQSLSTLQKIKQVAFGSEYLFPSISTIERPMNGSTLNAAFKKMGYETFSPHGIRATASTWANSRGFRSDVIERQLAHTERNQIRAAYNRANYMEERKAMMQAWADFVEPRQTEPLGE